MCVCSRMVWGSPRFKRRLEVCVCVCGGGGGGGGGRAGKQKVYIGWLYGQQGNGVGGACFRKLIIISK